MDVLLAAALATLPVGPLLSQASPQPSGVCTAFVVQEGARLRLFTARHCLRRPGVRLWLPGLEGDALNTGRSQWTTVHPQAESAWQPWRGTADVAWTPAPALPQGHAPFRPGPLPAPGTRVWVLGYPHGKGPQRLTCRYAGVIVLTTRPPQVRPSLRCTPRPSPSLHGFSGGPVVDPQGRAIGVLASGSAAPEGGILPGFEPLSPQGFQDGWSRFPLITDAGTPIHRLEVEFEGGVVHRFRAVSPQGAVWSQWPWPPRLQGPKPTASVGP